MFRFLPFFSLIIATPSHIDVHSVRKDLKGIEGVKNIHELHSNYP
jgi:hypothetical protein